MKNDIETIPPIIAASRGRVGDELAFSYPAVLEVVNLCTANAIAVLGVEIFRVRSGDYYTEHLSTYDQEIRRGADIEKGDWISYVSDNNRCAEEFLRLNPTGDDHACVLTTASWTEFCAAQLMR